MKVALAAPYFGVAEDPCQGGEASLKVAAVPWETARLYGGAYCLGAPFLVQDNFEAGLD